MAIDMARLLAATCMTGTIVLAPSIASAQTNSGDAQAKQEGDSSTDIVVTAQKRTERLLDVPSSISVLSSQDIQNRSLDSLQDYAAYIPSMSIQNIGTPGQSRVVIRGISTNDVAQPPLVGYYIDDTPYGSSTAGTRGSQHGLDLMPYDVERIEVLKGPQGTLYGASAMGGLVKYVLKQPSLEHSNFQVGSELETIDHSGGVGWTVRALGSVPIVADKLAIQLSGYANRVPGYIDNIGLNVNDENHGHSEGGHLELLWKPQDNLKIKLSAIFQNSDYYGLSTVNVNKGTVTPTYGDYTRKTSLPEQFVDRLQYYTMSADWSLGFATLTEAASYSEVKQRQVWDLTRTAGPLIPVVTANAYPAEPVNLQFSFGLKKWTQELRLASNSKGPLKWLVGGFYTEENTTNDQLYTPFTAPDVVDQRISLLGLAHFPIKLREVAVFANVTYNLTNRLELAGGLRYANDRQDFNYTQGGLFLAPFAISTSHLSEGVATWSASASYHFSHDAMLYFRAASGYRPGAANAVSNIVVPPTYASDSLINYELGFKGDLLDKKLNIEAGIFYIDWSKIQLTARLPVTNYVYTNNGGSAVSKGVELNTTYALTPALRVRTNVTYTDAHLTQAVPALGALAGDQLPASPHWQGSAGGDYYRAVSNDLAIFLGATYIYRGRMFSAAQSIPSSQPIGAMSTRVDAYVGTEYRDIKFRLFVKNLVAEKSFISVYNAYDAAHPLYVPDQPRTIGISLDKRF